jgi:predicted transcriptional regulator
MPNHCARLSQTDVDEIRRLAGQVPQSQLAARFGVDQGHISHIKHGKVW